MPAAVNDAIAPAIHRARAEDIPTLAYHFAVNLTSELKRPFFPGFSDDVTAQLLAASWPGNVRELKNAIERSVYRSAKPSEPIENIITDPFVSPFEEFALATRTTKPEGDDDAVSTPKQSLSFPLSFKEVVAGLERD